jgi:hypothetical protein
MKLSLLANSFLDPIMNCIWDQIHRALGNNIWKFSSEHQIFVNFHFCICRCNLAFTQIVVAEYSCHFPSYLDLHIQDLPFDFVTRPSRTCRCVNKIKRHFKSAEFSVKFGSSLEWYPRAPVWTVAGRRPRRPDTTLVTLGYVGGLAQRKYNMYTSWV